MHGRERGDERAVDAAGRVAVGGKVERRFGPSVGLLEPSYCVLWRLEQSRRCPFLLEPLVYRPP